MYLVVINSVSVPYLVAAAPPPIHSVANWQKFRPQNTKVAPQKSQRPEKSAAEFSADIENNGRKVAELFFEVCYSHKSFDFWQK
jgi:hypothetical protein